MEQEDKDLVARLKAMARCEHDDFSVAGEAAQRIEELARWSEYLMAQVKKYKPVCCRCGRPATCRWPAIDPDIPSRPYCEACVDAARMELLVAMQEMQKEVEDSGG